MKANDMNDKQKLAQDADMQELNAEEMEGVTGGGIKEVVAATTLAAMAMTGNTVSAFGLASALAEGNGAFVEAAPEREAYGLEFAGEMTGALQIDAGGIEAGVEEVNLVLGGEIEAAVANEAGFWEAPAEEASIAPTFRVGGQREIRLNDLARSAGIHGTVEGVAVMNDADAAYFEVFTDGSGDRVIRFLQSFDELTLGLVTAGDIPMVTLTGAVIVGEAPAGEAVPVVEAEPVKEAVPAGETTTIEEDVPVAEEAPAEADDEEIAMEQAREAGEDAQDAALAETAEETEAAGGENAEPTLLDMAEEEASDETAGAMIEDSDALRNAMMADLIEAAVESRRTEGIYAALDCSFATLAENVQMLENPETGAIETDGSQIIKMTYDAVAANFDKPSEQLMGAIGAATVRADERGDLRALGRDAVLGRMVAAESNSSYADAMKHTKSYFDAIMQGIAETCPGFKPFVPFLKKFGDDIFGIGDSPNAAVLKKLDAIEAQIQQSEAAIKRDTYNVVSLRSIGDKYSTVADKAELIEDKIGNIMGNSALSDAQKLQQVADLLNNSEFAALESAMNGATKCFTSNVNDIFDRQSIFEAAYARACESVMFSGEALKISTPYIARQLAVYLAAYGVMNQVYNAYEQVYGIGSLTATRQKMCERLGGVDLNGNTTGGSVGQKVKAYYGRDRYTFVNRGTASIRLGRGVVASRIVKDKWYDAHYYIDGWIQGIPLNAGQVEALCNYAASRKESLFDYLFNDLGFVPVNSPSVDVERFFPEAHADQWANVQGSTQSGGLRKKATAAMMTCYDRVNGKWQRPSGRVAMVDGKQTLASTLDHSNRNRYIKCSLLSATDVGVNKSDMESIFVDYDYSNKWIGYRNMDLLILLPA